MRPHGAFILARYSTDNQSADSIEVQVGKCSEWCNAHDLPILGIYADYAVSGMKDTRPQYEAMMSALRAGQADTVVIYDQSRMFRLLTAWFEFRRELESMDVRVVSVTQPLVGGDLRDPANFMNEGVTALFSQMWALHTRQKTSDAKRRKAHLGEHNGGIPPLGYKVVAKRLEIDEAEAAIVRRIFTEYASGSSYRAIIDGLNRDGLKTKRGNAFGSNSLHDLLHNEKYTGVLTYGGKPYRADGSRNSHASASENAIRTEDAVPAIISRELFDAVQERMAKNKHAQGGRPATRRSYPLRGKVFCGYCKSALYVSTSKQIYDYYKCGGKKNGNGCDGVIISVDKLEQLVADTLRAQLGSPTLTGSLAAALRAEAKRFQGDAVAKYQRLQDQERDISRKLDNATDAVLDGLTSPTLKKRIADLETQLAALRRELKSLRTQAEATDIPLDRLRELLSMALAPENTPALLSIVTRVEITAETITVWTILDPDPTKNPDYTSPGTQVDVTITGGTASGVPKVASLQLATFCVNSNFRMDGRRIDLMDTRSISLFSGGMGLDLGLMMAGIDIKIGQDVDPSCIQTIHANGHEAIGGDIRDISSREILDRIGMKAGEPFLICGGPPCQPFSTAGKRMGINDPRGSLFKDFVRMIGEIRPRFFVMENVKGLMSSSLKDESGKNTDIKVLDIILEEFHKLNYSTVYGIVDAVNYGVPQFRERFVLVGSRDGEDIFLPAPTHFRVHQNPDYRWVTLGNTIRDLEDQPGECAAFSEARLEFLRMIPEGGNWKNLPREVVERAMGGAFTSGGGKVGFYRRLAYAQPSPTVVTSPVQKATMMCHPTKDRPLSVAEYARIQQFPDDWIFMGTVADKYRQIGNAVPVGLAKAIGQMLISVANNDAEIVVKRTRGTSVHDRIQDAIRMGGFRKC